MLLPQTICQFPNWDIPPVDNALGWRVSVMDTYYRPPKIFTHTIFIQTQRQQQNTDTDEIQVKDIIKDNNRV